jgi:ribosomal protein L24E
MNVRRVLALAVACLTGAAALVAVPSSPATAAVGGPRFGPINIGGARFEWSSPAVGNVNGTDLVVVGGMNGHVYGFRSDGGTAFDAALPGPVASSPAIGDVSTANAGDEVVVGFGGTTRGPGGVAVLNSSGAKLCQFDAPGRSDGLAGVFNSPALGDVNGDGLADIVFGSFNDKIYAMTGGCSVLAQKDNQDTVWSGAAVRDVDGDGASEIFIGGDATVPNKSVGGYFRSLRYDGSGTLAERWVRPHAETFQGGAGFATINGQLAVVTGSGADYCRNQGVPDRCNNVSRQVFAFDPNSGGDLAGWPKQATYQTFLGGPAIGDVDGDGKDDVVIASTNYQGSGGAVDAFLGSGGRWTYRSADEIPSAPIIADTTGGGTPEVIVGTNGQLFVLNGPDGKEIQGGIAAGNWAHKSAAAVGVLDGGWVLATAGFDPGNSTGKLGVYTLPAPSSVPWGHYQKNPRRLGTDPTDAKPITCNSGYWLVASDGGIFSFGPQAPFFGSTGAIKLNQQIVGMAASPDRQGYEFVARDGGIFNFGNSNFYGSTGAIRLNQPIVGMAPTPTGQGYWLVASDGGIFAFGDANFFGSTGDIKLNKPIVGMASTPSGKGYWLVASDGGIFAFGDATFYGSTGDIRLNQPIVGMAAAPNGQGYWFVASDGGIFSFGPGAPFLGSTGNIRLNKPVVGMRATPSGNGYWFVATDGGIFSFGDAEFCGSTGNIRLNQPIVGMG